MFKGNYVNHLQGRIADLENYSHRLERDNDEVHEEASRNFNRFKNEERLRLEVEKQLQDIRTDFKLLKVKNNHLQNLMAEHNALLEEVKKQRSELKSERQKVRKLEKQLNRRSGKEGYFGLATPSALKINKKNSKEKLKAKKGGGVIGHPGHGRQSFSIEEADHVSMLDAEPPACTCGDHAKWVPGDIREHCVIEYIPARQEKHFYLKTEFTCTGCGNRSAVPTPGVVTGGLYANSVVAHVMTEHYLHGLTAGSVSRRENVKEGCFFKMASRCAKLLKPTYDKMLEYLKSCFLIHADESGWRNDGSKAYTWIFTNPEIAVFLYRDSRGSKEPKSIFGEDELNINFVTDRYKGYDFLKVCRQYCYTHLLRDLKTLEMDFPDEPEVAAFVIEMKPLLKDAIAMCKSKSPLDEYRKKATSIKDKIMEAAEREANHPGIQHFQNIFREHPERCFQWVKSPDIPAENNFAERGLRPGVIARKISFGSQSDQGMKNREVLMTFLHTARIRGLEPAKILEKALNLLGLNPQADIFPLLGF